MLAEITVNHGNSYTYLNVEDGLPTDDPAADMFGAIERWATEHGYELAPAFETYAADESAAGHHQRVVNLPIMCLVIYHGENIEGIVPCSTDNRIYTVRDGLTLFGTEHRLVLKTSADEAGDPDS